MQTLVQQLWHVMYVVTLVRLYTGGPVQIILLHLSKASPYLIIPNFCIGWGSCALHSMLYKVHVSLDLVQVQWHFKHSDVF